jgi:DNA polymerase V
MRKNLGGVVGVRLIKELRGEPSIEMDDPLTKKKMITTTRMFGTPVTNMRDVKEAVATYTSRAAEKLRRQQSAAKKIYVFVVPQEKSAAGHFQHGPTVGTHVILPYATSNTNQLIKPALELVEKLFEPGRNYKKAGVILSALEPDENIQGNLFMSQPENGQRFLMDMVDNVNFSMRDDILKFAAAGVKKNWKMRQELRSPRYTSRWEELCAVK